MGAVTAVFVVAPSPYGLVDGGITAFCAWICPGNFLEALFLPTLFQGSVDNQSLPCRIVFLARGCSRGDADAIPTVLPLSVPRRVLRLFNRFSAVGMTVDGDACIHCSACVQTCPMDIRSVGDKECIGCGVCMAACPTKAIGIRRPFGK